MHGAHAMFFTAFLPYAGSYAIVSPVTCNSSAFPRLTSFVKLAFLLSLLNLRNVRLRCGRLCGGLSCSLLIAHSVCPCRSVMSLADDSTQE